jgi:hypothetical protein
MWKAIENPPNDLQFIQDHWQRDVLESVQEDVISKWSLNWTTMILGHAIWEKRQQALQLFFPNASGRRATRLC